MSSDKFTKIITITGDSPNRLKLTWFKKHQPQLLKEILDYTNKLEDLTFAFRIWHWVNEEPYYIRCYCGNRVSKNMNWKMGYKRYCSSACSSRSNEVKEKQKETAKEKWGVSHYSKTGDFVKKVQKTSLEKWGVTNFSKTEEYKIKSKKTYLEKWGVDNFTKTKEYSEKSKKSSLLNWGVPFPTQSQTIKDKIRETNQKKWSTNHIFQSHQWRGDHFKIASDVNYITFLDGLNIMKCENTGHTFSITTDNYFGRKNNNINLCTICNPISSNCSLKEESLFDFIKNSYDGEISRNWKINRHEIDIYLPQLSLGFEFNGIWWHSDRLKSKWHHRDKSQFFSEHGIRIIHIWEDDWIYKSDIIKSQILNWISKTGNKIYARKCQVRELVNSGQFLDQNHIQGRDRSVIKLGLFSQGDLVSVMTFNKSEGRKKMPKGQWNLSRFCNKLDTNVIGGASKLLNYFISKYNPNRIISYADSDWSLGHLYYKLGFKFHSRTNPDYKYLLNNRRIHKSRFRKSNLKGSGSESHQTQLMGIYKIWDCGKIKFELLS